jgi:GrpB-like predicted nucleotidyltransferase (UPF0157 family)
MGDIELKVRIIEPSKDVFEIIDFYKKLLQGILPKDKIILIGAFAVPMCGKEEIDLLIEVDDVKISQEIIKDKSFGRFNIGPIVKGEGFCKTKKIFGIVCELHLVSKNHKRIKKYLQFIEKLRANPRILKKYCELKKSLDGCLESKYKKEKNKFLLNNYLI